MVDDIRAMLEGELSPTIQENLLGSAEIREVFNVSKVGKVAGLSRYASLHSRRVNAHRLRGKPRSLFNPSER